MYKKPSSSCEMSQEVLVATRVRSGKSYLVFLVDGAHESGSWR